MLKYFVKIFEKFPKFKSSLEFSYNTIDKNHKNPLYSKFKNNMLSYLTFMNLKQIFVIFCIFEFKDDETSSFCSCNQKKLKPDQFAK